MNVSNYFKSKSYGRRLLFLLMALFLVSGLVFTPNPILVLGMGGDGGPIDVDPIDPQEPPFQAPADGFTWSAPRRFGSNTTGDAMIDFHYDPVSMTYDRSYVYPSQWPAMFIGCQTAADADAGWSGTPNTYTWTIVGVSTTTVNQCVIYLNFPAQGTYTVRMEVRDPSGTVVPAGRDPAYFQQEVTIKDYFIVSIGDSLASGEGNPDIGLWATPNTPFPGWTQQRAAVWQDERCHRSGYSAPAQAALALEAADPHTTVTFISFACSGATIATPQYEWSLLADGNLTGPDANKHLGTGILGPYRGYISDLPYSDNFEGYIPSQMDQLRNALTSSNGQSPRQIDALILSAGGNDTHFGDAAIACLLTDDCWTNAFLKMDPHEDTNPVQILALLEDGQYRLQNPWGLGVDLFDRLDTELNALPPNKPSHVYLLQYADLTRNDTGRTDLGGACQMMDDVFAPISYLAIEPTEAQIAREQGLMGLNDAVKRAVEEHAADNWQLVDGISSYEVQPGIAPGTPGLFVRDGNGRGHGYCATDNWIRRADESEIIQGPVNFRKDTKGLLHPTVHGHQVIKDRILYYMLPDLLPPLVQDTPHITFSFSSGGLVDVAGENGWYIGSRDSNNINYSKVVAQAIVTSTVALNGATIRVNGNADCSLSGVVCAPLTHSEDMKQVTMTLEIPVSGIYRLLFNAQDTSGQVSVLEQEIKVDLVDPVLATPIGPFEVEEGGTVPLSATVSISDDGGLNYDWDLDNDGIFETTEEQPIFSAANLDGPTTRTIQVKVTDRAGQTDTEQATVDVLNTSPAVVYDNFDDNATNPSLWISVQQGGPTAAETNQRLEITLPANSSGTKFDAAYHSACKLRGDFDIRVDYQLLTWPSTNGVRLSLNTSQGNIERTSFGATSDFAGGPEAYLADFTGNVVGITSTPDRSGKLRLARVGNTLTGFYFGNGGWITVGSYETNAEDAPFALASWSHDPIFADQEVKLAFDNMMIKKGELICPPADTTAPTITLTTPAEEAVYQLGQTVNADYACQDESGGSGLASCVGTVPNGSPIDTSSIGEKTLTVNAEDNAGNTNSVTHAYRVIYNLTSFAGPVDNPPIMNIAKAGQAIPLKWRITDANGNPVTNLTGVTVTAVSLSCPSEPTTDAIEEYATSNSGLQNLGDGYYQWNWKSPTSYANSCKTLTLDFGEGAGYEHTALFQFKK